MAGKINTGSVQFGDSATAAENFHIKPLDNGTLAFNRGNEGTPLAQPLRINADNSISVGNLPTFHFRAFVVFDGTRDTSNTVSTANTPRLIRSSGNVVSVVRVAQGFYDITFATPMPDTNYGVVGTVWNNGNGQATFAESGATTPGAGGGTYPQNRTTSTVRVGTGTGAGASVDTQNVTVGIIR